MFTTPVGRGASALPSGLIQKLACGLLLFAALAAVALAAPPSSHALASSYCGALVPSGISNRCFQSTTTAHTWDYNRMNYGGGGTLAWSCAAILAGQSADITTGIYGSGCAANTNAYAMCHAPVVNYYWAFVSMQSSNGANHTINGYAKTDPCSGPAGRAARAAKRDATPAPHAFGVFRSGADASDALPSKLAGLAQDAGADPFSARSIGDSEAFVVAGQEDVCAGLPIGGDEAAALLCAPADSISADLLPLAVTTTPGGVTVWGAVPDGITDLTVVTDAGAQAVDGSDNGFAFETGNTPLQLNWTDAAGVAHAQPLSTSL